MSGYSDSASKTCVNAKKSLDESTGSLDSHSQEDPIIRQIPETPVIRRNSERDVSTERVSSLRTTKELLSPAPNIHENDRLQSWPFGPKLKSSGNRRKSRAGATQDQVEETPVTRRVDALSSTNMSGNKDENMHPFETCTQSSAGTEVLQHDVELSLADPDHNGFNQNSKEKDVVQRETSFDLKQKVSFAKSALMAMKEKHRQALRTKDQELLNEKATVHLLEDKHRDAMQAKDQELLQSKAQLESFKAQSAESKRVNGQEADEQASQPEQRNAHGSNEEEVTELRNEQQRALQAKDKELLQLGTEFESLKARSAADVQCKHFELQTANDEIATLRRQIASHRENVDVTALRKLRSQVKALKERRVTLDYKTKPKLKFTHTDLFDAAPELLPEHVFFNAEAKKEEIGKRRSRKQTFGRKLPNIRSERGQYPHREVYRHSPKPCKVIGNLSIDQTEEVGVSIATQHRPLQGLGPGEMIEDSLKDKDGENDPTSFEELMGVPRNAIPCIVDHQLAYREGSRVGLPYSSFVKTPLTWGF